LTWTTKSRGLYLASTLEGPARTPPHRTHPYLPGTWPKNPENTFSDLFMVMDILSTSGRCTVDLIDHGMTWATATAAYIEGWFDPEKREGPVGPPAQRGSGYVPGRSSPLPVILTGCTEGSAPMP